MCFLEVIYHLNRQKHYFNGIMIWSTQISYEKCAPLRKVKMKHIRYLTTYRLRILIEFTTTFFFFTSLHYPLLKLVMKSREKLRNIARLRFQQYDKLFCRSTQLGSSSFKRLSHEINQPLSHLIHSWSTPHSNIISDINHK